MLTWNISSFHVSHSSVTRVHMLQDSVRTSTLWPQSIWTVAYKSRPRVALCEFKIAEDGTINGAQYNSQRAANSPWCCVVTTFIRPSVSVAGANDDETDWVRKMAEAKLKPTAAAAAALPLGSAADAATTHAVLSIRRIPIDLILLEISICDAARPATTGAVEWKRSLPRFFRIGEGAGRDAVRIGFQFSYPSHTHGKACGIPIGIPLVAGQNLLIWVGRGCIAHTQYSIQGSTKWSSYVV